VCTCASRKITPGISDLRERKRESEREREKESVREKEIEKTSNIHTHTHTHCMCVCVCVCSCVCVHACVIVCRSPFLSTTLSVSLSSEMPGVIFQLVHVHTARTYSDF